MLLMQTPLSGPMLTETATEITQLATHRMLALQQREPQPNLAAWDALIQTAMVMQMLTMLSQTKSLNGLIQTPMDLGMNRLDLKGIIAPQPQVVQPETALDVSTQMVMDHRMRTVHGQLLMEPTLLQMMHHNGWIATVTDMETIHLERTEMPVRQQMEIQPPTDADARTLTETDILTLMGHGQSEMALMPIQMTPLVGAMLITMGTTTGLTMIVLRYSAPVFMTERVVQMLTETDILTLM